MIKLHVNAKQTLDSNIESPSHFSVFTEGLQHRPSYTGSATHMGIYFPCHSNAPRDTQGLIAIENSLFQQYHNQSLKLACRHF